MDYIDYLDYRWYNKGYRVQPIDFFKIKMKKTTSLDEALTKKVIHDLVEKILKGEDTGPLVKSLVDNNDFLSDLKVLTKREEIKSKIDF
jgi:hypothetical protein